MKFKNILLNASYTLSSNFLSLLVSTIVTIFLPKILGIEFYGYFQLYLFYVSYVGFLHFGWCDGIYLKYGGENYDDLDFPKFRGQYIMLAASQMLLTIILIVVISISNIKNEYKIVVLIASALNIVILNVRTFSTFILQATNRMKDYSVIIIIDRIVYIILVILLLLLRIKDFYWYIYADLIGKSASMVISLIKIKRISLIKMPIKFNFFEVLDNIKVGINLMFANIASTLIIGIIRFGIQKEWDVETFGKISLTLSISNLIMVFVNAISLAVFPLLKKIKENEYANVYNITRIILMPLIISLLIIYYPLSIVLGKWLPLYSESFRFMAIVFPMVVFECKVSLLTNTYLKALRKEKKIFFINLVSALTSLVVTVIVVFIMKSLFFSMFSIVMILAFRSFLAETILSKYLNIKIYKDIFTEILVVIAFIIISWNFKPILGFFIYLCVMFIYFFINKKDLKYVFLKYFSNGS